MARFRLALQTIAIVACACGSTQKPYNPFKVPRESFYPALKTVALAPSDRSPGRCAKPFVLRNGTVKMDSRLVSAAPCGG